MNNAWFNHPLEVYPSALCRQFGRLVTKCAYIFYTASCVGFIPFQYPLSFLPVKNLIFELPGYRHLSSCPPLSTEKCIPHYIKGLTVLEGAMKGRLSIIDQSPDLNLHHQR